MGITVVRAMARHRWRHCSTWGSRECSLSTPGGGRIGSTRGRRVQAERRSEEAVRMAQEHYFPWLPEW